MITPKELLLECPQIIWKKEHMGKVRSSLGKKPIDESFVTVSHESHRKIIQNFLGVCSLSYCMSMYIVTVK